MQDQSKPEQKPKFFLPLRKESWGEGWRDPGGVEQIMYFEQECIKKMWVCLLQPGGTLKLNETTREEWNFTCFVFSLPDILFQLWSGPTVLFCFVFL